MPASRPENETHPARPLCRAEVAPAGAPALRAVLVLLNTHTGGVGVYHARPAAHGDARMPLAHGARIMQNRTYFLRRTAVRRPLHC